MTRLHAVKLRSNLFLKTFLKSAVVFLSAMSFSLAVHANNENLFVFVFKNGVAQSDIRVQVGESSATTNDFGTASFSLSAGDHEVGYFQGEELFALTEVSLQSSVSSQVFLSLKNAGAEVELDLPLSAYEQEFDHQDLKEQTGPKGMLKMKIVDSASLQAVQGAKLFFRGYALEAQANEQGIAEVELSEGSYDISVVHPKYVMQVSKDVKVSADKMTEAELKLIKADIVLDEFVVSAPFVEGSLASNIAELKNSDVVGDAISSEQFSKTGDSDAAGALKRVTGITIVDGKFVFVRGLGERYSTVLLNGLHVPSPEPTKRVVPLDIFPAGVIQSMDIQKTWSSDLPGTFGGGTVLINSKDIPKEDNYIKAGISISLNDATGDSVSYNPDNDSPLPSAIISFSENFQSIGEEVRLPNGTVIKEGLNPQEMSELESAMVNYRSYGISETKLKPGTGLSGSFGQRFKTGSGLKYGAAGSLYYKNSEKNVEVEKDEYNVDETTGESIHTDDNEYEVTTFEEKYGGLLSFGFEPSDQNKFKYTFLGVNEFEDHTNVGDENDLSEGRPNERVFLQYTEKELYSHQLNGEHIIGAAEGQLFDALDIAWGYGLATATRLEPGTFEYEYKFSSGQFVLDQKKLFYLYSDLEDEVENARLDFSLPFEWNGRSNSIDFGYFVYDKERNLDNRRFKIEYSNSADPNPIDDIVSEANVQSGALDWLDSYKDDDFYTAEQELTAFYTKALISPFESLDLHFGLRNEQSTQTLYVGEDRIKTDLETSDSLPFFIGTYRFNDEHQLRFGVSQSISRPDFREFSPNRYKDPLTGDIIFGYEGLQSTEIANFDLKYEFFPNFDEFYSIGVFAKDFTNPIETVRNRADEDIEVSYRNAESATSVGLEFGFRKSLAGTASWLENYFVGGNYAYIDSEITLDKDAPENINDPFIPFLTSESRPMQGQSPYVANLKFGYDNFFTKRSAILLYNVYGERISSLGINGNPDTYEQPFHRLDFVVKWGLNDTYDEQEKKIGYEVSLKVKNILDSDLERTQGSDVVEKIKPGRSFTLGFSMKY